MHRSLQTLRERYPELAQCVPSIEEAYALLHAAYAAGNKVLICGNGGSMSDAEHIVGELMKSFTLRRPIPEDVRMRLESDGAEGALLAQKLEGALPAVALGAHTALTSATSNDVGGQLAYAQQVYGLGRAGDALLVLSTSGDSENCVFAATAARVLGMRVLAMTGVGGGRLAACADVALCVPAKETYQVQEYHLPIYHALCAMLEEEFFG